MQSRPHRRCEETGRTLSYGGKKDHVELAYDVEQSLVFIILTFAATHCLTKNTRGRSRDEDSQYDLVETWRPVNVAQNREFTDSASLRRIGRLVPADHSATLSI